MTTHYDPREIIMTLSQHLLTKQWCLVTAESCTGGEIAARLTDVPGSSQWFDAGLVTYSNAAKQRLLSVPAAVLTEYGAVSEQTVRAMAEGALIHSDANMSIAVSGVAGPEGGTTTKPVGTVWFAWGFANQCVARCQHFSGDRISIRQQAVLYALNTGLGLLTSLT